MMKISFLLVLFSFVSTISFADPQSDINKANKAYQDGFYTTSVDLYEKVIKEGYASSELYYNLGNAYYKLNEIPSSILFYERALKLDPGNEDIIYNLRVANNQIIDKIDQLPELFYERWWDSLKQMLAPDEWAIFSILLITLFFVLIALFLLSTSIRVRRGLLTSGVIVLVFTSFVFIIANETYTKAMKKHEAIVFSASLPVKSSPEESGTDLFVIHEGLKVEIIDELTGWKEIRIDNGSKGWVKSETITPI